jgi:hypothetical protein
MGINEKIVLWCGSAPNQRAFAYKVHREFGLAGIVIDEKKSTVQKKQSTGILKRIFQRLRFRNIHNAWTGLQNYYREKYPEWPSVPILRTDTINSQDAFNFTTGINPKLIVVSGTNLVKEPLLSIPVEIGIINLHTGLSPYVKGGPNCTNWCIANNDWHLVGNTIMWINAGIDTGNIITTETTDIRSCKSLLRAHIQVMEHAHALYLRSISYLLNSAPPYRSVPQNTIDKGHLYLSKMWDGKQKAQLLKNWMNRKSSVLNEQPVTINLPY